MGRAEARTALTNDASTRDEPVEIGRSRESPVSTDAGKVEAIQQRQQQETNGDDEPRTDNEPTTRDDEEKEHPRFEKQEKTASDGDQHSNLVEFPSKRTSNVGRKRQGERLSVNCVKASRNTWAVRIRHLDDEWPPVVVKRVSDEIFKQMTRNKKRYAQFKQNQIDQWKLGTVRPDIARGSNAD